MDTSLMSLPSELLSSILAYLPVESLLTFSATSRTCQILAHRALQTLNLAVLPTEVHCHMALMSREAQGQKVYSYGDQMLDLLHAGVAKQTKIPTRLPATKGKPNPVARLDQQISAQNKIATEILSSRSLSNLRNLSLQIYDLRSPELAKAMATNLQKLRHLELRFAHPFVHDQCLPASYWHEAPAGTPAWNALVGLGQENQQNLRLRGLLSLRIERAGLTSAQLKRFVQSNPLLKQLHLVNVAGVDQDFVQWLAVYCEGGKSRIEEITLESCPQLKMQRIEDFAWLAGIVESEVHYLSLYKCRNVRHDMLVRLIEEGNDDEDDEEGLELDLLETLIPPKGPARHFGIVEEFTTSRPVSGLVMQTGHALGTDKIEVDPEYLALSVAA